MVPTGGPEGWKAVLADPELHWKRGRSARTLAYAWGAAEGCPPEVEAALETDERLKGFRPVYGFPEYKTPLPGGRRASQTDLMVLATYGDRHMTVGVEGKVDEGFDVEVTEWLRGASPGKLQRLAFLRERLGLDGTDIGRVRYQLLHRTASARIEAERNGSEVAVMLVHSWGEQAGGFDDFRRFGTLLGVTVGIGSVGYSESARVWLGWVEGDPRFLKR